MTKEFDGGNPHAEDLWVRGGLEALVGDQSTFRIQEVRLGRDQGTGVGAQRITRDVDIKVQSATIIQLQCAG